MNAPETPACWVYIYNASMKTLRVLPGLTVKHEGSVGGPLNTTQIAYLDSTGHKTTRWFFKEGDVSKRQTAYFVWLEERDDARAAKALMTRRLEDVHKRLERLVQMLHITELERRRILSGDIHVEEGECLQYSEV